MSALIPKIGRWYQDRTTGQLFEVVAIEGDETSVEVQYLDGEIASLDPDVWAEMDLLRAAAPEDWRTSYELDAEDELDPDAALHPVEWSSPINWFEPDTVLGVEDI